MKKKDSRLSPQEKSNAVGEFIGYAAIMGKDDIAEMPRLLTFFTPSP
jgi:hypothetical protein